MADSNPGGDVTAIRVGSKDAPGGQVTLPSPGDRKPGIALTKSAFWLSGALAVCGALAAGATFFIPSILRGPAVMNGSARGTALVALAVAVPTLLLAMVFTVKTSLRALLIWLGAVGYLLYNAILFLFATPFNRLFLVYVTMLTLSIWSLATLLHQIDVPRLGERFSARVPARAIAAYAIVVVILNALVWLRNVVPAIISTKSPAWLDGTGIATNPVYVQDLGFWLPLMTVAAVWLWRRKPWGYLVVGALLCMWVMESLSIAVDQWFGHAADPASPVASAAVVPAFAALAVLGLIPLYFYFRGLNGTTR